MLKHAIPRWQENWKVSSRFKVTGCMSLDDKGFERSRLMGSSWDLGVVGKKKRNYILDKCSLMGDNFLILRKKP